MITRCQFDSSSGRRVGARQENAFMPQLKVLAEQMLDPAIMWDKPFAIDLPPGFDPAVEHELVLRVSKDRFAAGIWKPVVIGVVQQPARVEKESLASPVID